MDLSESSLEWWEYQCRERRTEICVSLLIFGSCILYSKFLLVLCADKCFLPSPLNPEFSEVTLRLFMNGIFPAHHVTTLMCYWIKQWLKCKKSSRYNDLQIKGGRIHIKTFH